MRGIYIRPFLLQISNYFHKRVTLPRWRLNLFGTICLVIGVFTGGYILTQNLFTRIFAAGDTTFTWNFATPSDYTLSDASLIDVSGSAALLKILEYDSEINTALLLHLNDAVTDDSDNAHSVIANNLSYAAGRLNNAGDFDGSTTSLTITDTAALSLSQGHSLEAWIKFDTAFSSGSHPNKQGLFDKGEYQLYFDHETGKLTYELARNTGINWEQVAGPDSVTGAATGNTWDSTGQAFFNTSVSTGTIGSGGYLYVGLGADANDAEVWRWDGTTWTKIGGDSLNDGWTTNYDGVNSLATDGTNVFAGLGNTAGEAEIWQWNGTSWSKIGGDGTGTGGQSFGNSNIYEMVSTLHVTGTTLIAGLGNGAGDAEVWSCTIGSCQVTSGWSKIGGDGTGSGGQSWTNVYDQVTAITSDDTTLFVGLGNTAGEAEVWSCSLGSCAVTSGWTKRGGDGTGSGGQSWGGNAHEQVTALELVGSSLYVGTGNTNGDGEVWYCATAISCTVTTGWTLVGGDTIAWTGGAHNQVWSLESDNTYLFAALGNDAGEDEVWRCTLSVGGAANDCTEGASWSKIADGGGTPVGFNPVPHTRVQDLEINNGQLYAGLTNASRNAPAEMWQYNISGASWTRIGGAFLNGSWSTAGITTIETMNTADGKLYAGTGSTNVGGAYVYEFDGTTWIPIGGNGLNSSWIRNFTVQAMVVYEGELYVGLAGAAGDGDLYKWNDGTDTWSQIGGDGTGWAASTFESVQSLSVYNGNLYIGLGNTGNDGDIFEYNGSTFTQMGGGTSPANSDWGATGYAAVYAMAILNNQLYAGVGTASSNSQDGEVWVYTGTGNDWTKVGGDTANSWQTNYETVESLATFNGKLYAGLGFQAGDAEIYEYSGSGDTWARVAGDGTPAAWTDGIFDRVATMQTYNGKLYAGLGITAGEAEVYVYDTESWTRIGGDGDNNGWLTTNETVRSMTVYQGRLFAGLGDTLNVDRAIYAYGDDEILQSTFTSLDTNWHHVAATYDGTTMKLFIDGVLDSSSTPTPAVTMADTNTSLRIGLLAGNQENGLPAGRFTGLIDEVRISSAARTTFNSTPYTTEGQTVKPNSAVGISGIKNWETFAATETLNGGTITFRLSDDNGSTWKYWSGSAWSSSASLSEANDEDTINTNIPTFPVTSAGLLWQAILDGDGTQQVILSTVTIEATADSTAPTPPDTLTSLSASGGTAINTDSWYAHSAPYFTWSGATDTGGSGVSGYYVYFGTDNTADPQTAGTFQASATYTAASLSSGTTYFLRIRARDSAQNVSTIWAPFIYKYDSVGPTNPSTVSVSPGGYSASNDFTFSWPAASDTSAGIQYYQYKTGASSGTLSDWQNTASTSINIPDAAYQTDANTFYLRTVDNAGNTSSQITATYYFGGDGPSVPQFLSVTPSSNTTNSYAFSWQAPATYSGNVNELTYCYTVNTLPTSSSCTFTSAGATSLSASSFATQVGLNTFYLVAKNPATAGGAINYGAYTSVTFTANTSAPGIPLNIDIGDISIKSTETWRLALTWNAPSDIGSGVSSYKILRSTDNATFEEIASSTGTSYVDTELEQIDYYYQVQACDSVDNCGAATTVVSGTPTGKFTEAAALTSGPVATSVTTKKATVSWTTGRESDSKIQYGTSPGNYFTSEPSNSTPKTSHTIELTNLQPGTTYYYKAKWTDEDGNTGTSSEKSFSTEPAPAVSEVKVTNIGLTQALVNFRVIGASSVEVLFGETTAFGGVEKVTTSKVEGDYTVQIEGLKDGTKYYYRINALDEEGGEYEGTTLDFETLPRPKITNVRVQQVKGTAQPTVLITWNTNTEVSSIITYYPQGRANESRDEINLEPKKEHRLTLRGLNPQTPYELVAKGRDKQGNEGVSDIQKFTTATDTRNPVISDLRIQGSTQRVQNGQEQIAQLVISWNSDEPATTQVEYGEGTGNSYPFKTQEDTNLKSNHLVVISNLSPSKVYHLRAATKDTAGNIGYSQDNVTITPKETDSALDLVLSNLQQIFGFLGDLQ